MNCDGLQTFEFGHNYLNLCLYACNGFGVIDPTPVSEILVIMSWYRNWGGNGGGYGKGPHGKKQYRSGGGNNLSNWMDQIDKDLEEQELRTAVMPILKEIRSQQWNAMFPRMMPMMATMNAKSETTDDKAEKKILELEKPLEDREKTTECALDNRLEEMEARLANALQPTAQ